MLREAPEAGRETHAKGETFQQWYGRIEALHGFDDQMLPLGNSYDGPLAIPPEKEWDLHKLSKHLKPTPDLAQAEIDALLVQLGRRTFQVGPEHVSHPDGISVAEVNPKQIRLSVQRGGEEPNSP